MSGSSTAIKPPPAWSATFSRAESTLVIATYSAQAMDAADLEPFLSWVEEAIERDSGPDVSERARFTDAAGYVNEVRVAYWRDPQSFADWAASGIVSDWWEHPDRTSGPAGIWREVVAVPSNRFETIFSSPAITIGSRRIADDIEGPIEAHGYWGSMRDRLPVSRHDALLSAFGEELLPPEGSRGTGRRIIVGAPANLTLIRSGQDTAQCPSDELAEYQDVIRPVLEKGMNFLRDNPEQTGCCSCRFMEEVEDSGETSARSFGFAWFLTLGHLERWAKSHPTHLAIYNRFSAFAKKRGPSLKLSLWHEVSVVPDGASTFEYVNCHDRTGLLGLFDENRPD